MKIAIVLLLCAAAVSSFTVVERAWSGAGLENEDFGDLFEYELEYENEDFGVHFEYEVEYEYGSGLDRFETYLNY
jgi:hypothetical protein